MGEMPVSMTEAFDAGFDLFKREPELILADVWWRAPKGASFPEQHEFVEGYRAAREKHDEYEREKREHQ